MDLTSHLNIFKNFRMEQVKIVTSNIGAVMEEFNKTIIPNPEWQRGDVWSNNMRIALVETILHKMPIPTLTFWEQPNGNNIVVDGRQRLTAINKFMSNQLKLKFKNLSDDEQTTFKSTQIFIMLFPSKTDPEDISCYFQKINSGGKSLSNGELINSHNTSPIVKEVLRLFFTSNDFKTRWNTLFPKVSETSRMAHLENIVPLLTSSIEGVDKLSKSYPIISSTLTKVTQEDIISHRDEFTTRLNLYLNILIEINKKVEGWADNWKTGIPLLRQLAAVWYSIIDTQIIVNNAKTLQEFWSSFYEALAQDEEVEDKWYAELRRNASKAQLKKEIEFALEIVY